MFLKEVVDLFFIPLAAVGWFYRRNNKKLSFNLDFLIDYSRFVGFNIPWTHVFIWFIRHFFGFDIQPKSSIYTVLVIFAAFSQSVIFETINKYVDIKLCIKESLNDNSGNIGDVSESQK